MAGAVDQETTRPFKAGSLLFTVRAGHPDDRALIEELFGDLPYPDPSDAPVETFDLTRLVDGSEPRWSLRGPRLDDRSDLTLVGVLTSLMGAVNLAALDAGPDSLHLHAAAAVRDGGAVIIAASRNTGKTTTVAYLVQRGWAFVTDETVSLPAEGEVIAGFAKPLSIKPGGDRLVDHLDPWMIPARADGHDSFRFVRVGASGAAISEGDRPRLVVLLQRPDDAATDAVSAPLHPADAVVALMQETLDAERFGPSARRLAILAASTPCYQVAIGTPSRTADHIEALFEREPGPALAVDVLPESTTITTGVVSIAIGDRMVVHHTGTGQIFALDAVATQIWEQLGGWRDHGLDLAGPVIRPFVSQLEALGVLSTTASTPERLAPGQA